jgi:RES domain-containing protein
MTQLLPTATAFAETVYRSVSPKFATESDLLTGAGSKRHGGRWNPPGIAVVYISLTPETAMAETLAHYRYFDIPIEDAMPRTFVAIEVKLKAILDLRQGPVRQRLQVSMNRILTVDWRKDARAGQVPITQLLGQAAAEVGLEGLIVPSIADLRGHNVLVFPENLQSGSTAVVLHSDGL